MCRPWRRLQASGYLGGSLPVAAGLYYRPELIAARIGLRAVPERQIVLVGARDLDPPEVTYLASARISRSARLLTWAPPDFSAGWAVVRALDLDVADPAQVCWACAWAPGGLSSAQVAGASACWARRRARLPP